ncbi:hypothetical protein BV898_10953 [Hypsibius exemplaris]|uniref:Uncharacterized protein n=1 Tax=Hypsibius exemplaris TaxID=2072580 RepID=A0A1W0WHX0_HYPEX|nr:hypothetical protein BV898_10953 [Hypsibius exemplaris]
MDGECWRLRWTVEFSEHFMSNETVVRLYVTGPFAGVDGNGKAQQGVAQHAQQDETDDDFFVVSQFVGQKPARGFPNFRRPESRRNDPAFGEG